MSDAPAQSVDAALLLPDLGYGHVTTHHAVAKYKIARKYANFMSEEAVDTWVVLYVPTGENLSHHESENAARAAVRKYEAADRVRA